MQQADDSEQSVSQRKHRSKRGKKINSVAYKPVERELDRKSLEQQEHSREMRRLDALERNNHKP